jgi:hypothetical protein
LQGDHHIGAPGYHDGKIYVPIEGTPSVWLLNTLPIKTTVLEGGSLRQNGSFPWCAINPWNSLLYTSIFGNNEFEFDINTGQMIPSSDNGDVDPVYIYDPNHQFAFVGEMLLGGGVMHRAQGGCFSNNGHLYITYDTDKHQKGEIRAYSALNGEFLGSKEILYSDDVDQGELEGLSLGHIIHNDGSSTYIHALVLDNDWPSKDEVYLYHYFVPDPDVI